MRAFKVSTRDLKRPGRVSRAAFHKKNFGNRAVFGAGFCAAEAAAVVRAPAGAADAAAAREASGLPGRDGVLHAGRVGGA